MKLTNVPSSNLRDLSVTPLVIGFLSRKVIRRLDSSVLEDPAARADPPGPPQRSVRGESGVDLSITEPSSSISPI
jgi:hypothetical protein